MVKREGGGVVSIRKTPAQSIAAHLEKVAERDARTAEIDHYADAYRGRRIVRLTDAGRYTHRSSTTFA